MSWNALIRQACQTSLIIFFLVVLTLAAVAEEAPSINFAVNAFRVDGPNPIDSESTQVILEPFIGNFDSLDGLLGAVDALQNGLNNRGFTFYRVFLPPQTLEGGEVILEIAAVTLGEVKVEGNEYFSADNIIASLPSVVPG
ncbi:MAG: POTRA domain-containing protein, partial [Pseudomonadota bacterium]